MAVADFSDDDPNLRVLKNVGGLEFYSTWKSWLYLLRIQRRGFELAPKRARHYEQYYEIVSPVKGEDTSFSGETPRAAAKKGLYGLTFNY